MMRRSLEGCTTILWGRRGPSKANQNNTNPHQTHTKATQSQLIANRKPYQSHTKATPKPHQSHTKATLKGLRDRKPPSVGQPNQEWPGRRRTSNLQHPTSNTQCLPFVQSMNVGRWMLDVGCSQGSWRGMGRRAAGAFRHLPLGIG